MFCCFFYDNIHVKIHRHETYAWSFTGRLTQLKICADKKTTAFRDTVSLTKRETDVFCLMLEGRSNREIAENLGLTENTIKTHVRNILSKYNAPSRTELFRKMLKP